MEREKVEAMYDRIPEDLKSCIEPVVDEHGYELMNVESVKDRGSTVLRVTVDTVSGDGRVPVDAIASLSRELGTGLDAEDIVSGAYRLEVSSPGLDRMLARQKDFKAAVGSQVKLKTLRPLDGRRKFRGELVEFNEQEAVLTVDGERLTVPFVEIEKANSVYSFSSADFRGEEQA
ncbi:MAG: ribosome maturation factor RimP [Proteobacteria bacterium TMED72]|nr:MAG: ribosome maturation factor RimP [Proteobacteria bacterium TMED72]